MQKITGGFRRMTRRMDDFNFQLAYFKSFTILCYMNGKVCLRIGTVNNGCAGFLCKIKMTGNEISMEMRFEDILDFCALALSQLNIFFVITKRINYHSFAVGFNKISCFREAVRIKLFYNHGSFSWNLE